MVLQRWDPFYDFRRMHEAMNRRRRDFAPAHSVATAHLVSNGRGWAIPVDVVEEGDDILVKASLPGVNPDDIDVTIEDRLLTIKGETKAAVERTEGGYLMQERRTGSFHRALRLPDTVDSEKAKTQYDNGVLTVVLPKAESKKAKHLKVVTGKELESSA